MFLVKDLILLYGTPVLFTLLMIYSNLPFIIAGFGVIYGTIKVSRKLKKTCKKDISGKKLQTYPRI